MTTPVKVGTELLVNTVIASDQTEPTVTQLSDGGIVVTWQSQGQDTSLFGVYGQRYDASGAADGVEFRINTFTTGDQSDASVAAVAGGGFVVTWASDGQDGAGEGVYGQIYNANGTVAVSEFRVNSTTADDQTVPSVTGLDNGGFVVTWQSMAQDGSDNGVYAQVYNANGSVAVSEFRVNSFTTTAQEFSDVTALSDGGFIVVWQSHLQTGGTNNYDIYAQRYDASGAIVESEFLVNASQSDVQLYPSITTLENGGFVVTWMSLNEDGDSYGIFGQRYEANGNVAGTAFQANTTTANEQENPVVTALDDGGFVVVWQSNGQDGDGYGIYGQRFDANGAAAGTEFQVNTTFANWQTNPAVSAVDGGGFMVTWQSSGQDTSGTGIYSQLFSYTSADFTAGDDSVSLYGRGQSVDGLDGADTITGADYASGGDTINGSAGNDTLSGLAGDDTLNGGANKDTLDGGDGDDTLDGGAGTDTVSYASATSSVIVSLDSQGGSQNTLSAGIDTLSNFENLTGSAFGDNLTGDANANRLDGGTGGDDMIVGLDGNDKLYGKAGGDEIEGGNDNDKLWGGAGKDLLKGGNDDDKLWGDGGKDRLKGGDGKDKLYGGKGNDKLWGGAGKDVFVFAKKEGKDTINDFQNGKDKIDLKAFNFNNKAAALAEFYEIGSGSNDKMGFKYKGTEIIIKGIDMADLSGADIII